MCEKDLETEQNFSILNPTLLAITAFFPVLLRYPTGGLGTQPLWDMFLIPASSLQLQLLNRGLVFSTPSYLTLILSPTHLISNWLTSCLHPGYIIVRHPTSSRGGHKSHSFNPSTVKVISWYSLIGFTCYLHRSIFYFDSLPGSIC